MAALDLSMPPKKRHRQTPDPSPYSEQTEETASHLLSARDAQASPEESIHPSSTSSSLDTSSPSSPPSSVESPQESPPSKETQSSTGSSHLETSPSSSDSQMRSHQFLVHTTQRSESDTSEESTSEKSPQSSSDTSDKNKVTTSSNSDSDAYFLPTAGVKGDEPSSKSSRTVRFQSLRKRNEALLREGDDPRSRNHHGSVVDNRPSAATIREQQQMRNAQRSALLAVRGHQGPLHLLAHTMFRCASPRFRERWLDSAQIFSLLQSGHFMDQFESLLDTSLRNFIMFDSGLESSAESSSGSRSDSMTYRTGQASGSRTQSASSPERSGQPSTLRNGQSMSDSPIDKLCPRNTSFTPGRHDNASPSQATRTCPPAENPFLPMTGKQEPVEDVILLDTDCASQEKAHYSSIDRHTASVDSPVESSSTSLSAAREPSSHAVLDLEHPPLWTHSGKPSTATASDSNTPSSSHAICSALTDDRTEPASSIRTSLITSTPEVENKLRPPGDSPGMAEEESMSVTEEAALQQSYRVAEDTDNLRLTEDGVTLTLSRTSMWRAFSEIGTEMIINRSGRRMFPFVTVQLSGLEERRVYEVEMEIVPADCRRYKFVNNSWTAVGVADSPIANFPYSHPDSPNTGEYWMSRQSQFARVKLTNNRDSSDGNMLLPSMHKYVVQITVRHVQDVDTSRSLRNFRFRLDITSFIAVTAYQNELVTRLKIHNNPFAKAFRDTNILVSGKKGVSKRRHYKCGDESGESGDEGQAPAKKRETGVTVRGSGDSRDTATFFSPPAFDLESLHLTHFAHLAHHARAGREALTLSQPPFL